VAGYRAPGGGIDPSARVIVGQAERLEDGVDLGRRIF